ncbi:dihydroneopterin triphosphate diphosphatase [Parachitinimonas caeni]|uniref:Dihydroneopterin triphosphate diphosphatase n=1 Tax=Parachitinimonas caeni TaxID=3031301 RepID=A0ABT7DWS7_9NEIS|nr:dihydroneopterin triphosphate diphosphatase [Parachitinimonas caeni]MDK2124439.1 dihydroneopterin triphosphate diphosphatase [Parachitinimonas caeni]
MTDAVATNVRYKQPRSVLVVIYTEKLDVLLLERIDYKHAWQSVTGSIEGLESLRDTAIREVAEETGLDATVYELQDWQLESDFEIFEVWRHRYAPGVTHNTEHVFGLRLPERIDPRINPEEHSEWRWLGWEQAAELVFSPSNAEALRILPEMSKRFGPDHQ